MFFLSFSRFLGGHEVSGKCSGRRARRARKEASHVQPRHLAGQGGLRSQAAVLQQRQVSPGRRSDAGEEHQRDAVLCFSGSVELSLAQIHRLSSQANLGHSDLDPRVTADIQPGLYPSAKPSSPSGAADLLLLHTAASGHEAGLGLAQLRPHRLRFESRSETSGRDRDAVDRRLDRKPDQVGLLRQQGNEEGPGREARGLRHRPL